MMDRVALAELWHRRASVKRATIFGSADAKLRPVAVPSQVDICIPGMVGSDFDKGGLAIVSVNPAGGRDGFTPTSGDEELYAAAAELRQFSDQDRFERLNEAFVVGMPAWGPQWRVINSILIATRMGITQIAYPYLVPFRSRGDAGSALPELILRQGYVTGFRDIIAALRPSHIVAVDRPSQRACFLARDELDLPCDITYLTRKRDAHSERIATLKLLAKNFEIPLHPS